MLRVVTFNTWKCDGDYDARLPLMAQELARVDADVVWRRSRSRLCEASDDAVGCASGV